MNPAQGLPVTITHARRERPGLPSTRASRPHRSWEVGFGVNGIGNRIDVDGRGADELRLDSLFSGGEFQDLPTVPVGDNASSFRSTSRANAPTTRVVDDHRGIRPRLQRHVVPRRCTNSGSTAFSCAVAPATSRNDGNRPAAPDTTSPRASASTLDCSAPAPISSASATSPIAFSLRFMAGNP